MRSLIRRFTRNSLFEITTWHGDSIELTLSPCDPLDTTKKIYVENRWGRIIITGYKVISGGTWETGPLENVYTGPIVPT